MINKEWHKAKILGYQGCGYDRNGNVNHIVTLAFGDVHPTAEAFFCKGSINAKVFNLREKDLYGKDVWVVINSNSKASHLYMNEIDGICLEDPNETITR